MTVSPPNTPSPPLAAPRSIRGSIRGPVRQPPGPVGQTSGSRRRALARRLLHGTPGRMRLLAALGVLAALLVGATCANALLASRAAVERAANNTAQVIRVQTIHVQLLRADALATNAFLVGGLEPADQRAKYDQAISAATTAIAEAAAAQPADGRALGALADRVRAYATLVEQARANNRLGLPVGAQYLRQASAGLRADAIPIVQLVTTANEGRSTAEFDRADPSEQLLLGAAALLGLIGIALWLARTTHRYLNGALTGALGLLLVALVLTATTLGDIGQTTSAVARGDYASAVALANVSTAANDARANESLTLIARGSGAAFEKAWATDDQFVRKNIDASIPDLQTTWGEYADTHKQVRTLDDNGDWEGAVALSTKASGAAAVFDAFDGQATRFRDVASASAVDRLSGLGGWTPLYAVGVSLAALVACWLIVRGLGRRIEEYK